MAFAADHKVIVDRDPQRLGRRLDLPRHLDVVAAGFGIVIRVCPVLFNEISQQLLRSVALSAPLFP